MSVVSVSSRAPKENIYLFIDGGYLRGRLSAFSEEFFNDELIDINFDQLRRTVGANKAWYYDCDLPQRKNEDKAGYETRLAKQQNDWDLIRELPGSHIFAGEVKSEGRKLRQKGIDVKMAVDMLQHAISGNMEKCVLLAGDMDFYPIVEALMMHGIWVTVWYAESGVSKELLDAADERKKMDLLSVFNLSTSQFREKYPIPDESSQMEKGTSGYDRIGEEILEDGREIEVYKRDNDHLFIFPCKVNTTHFHHVSHNNIEFLKKYVKSRYDLGC